MSISAVSQLKRLKAATNFFVCLFRFFKLIAVAILLKKRNEQAEKKLADSSGLVAKLH